MSSQGEELIPNEEDEDVNVDMGYFEEDEGGEPEPSETADTSNRSIKSLGMLTKRFIKFLQESPVGLVDINLVRFEQLSFLKRSFSRLRTNSTFHRSDESTILQTFWKGST